MDLSTQTVVLVSVLTIAGAVLGGAVAHWKRGSAHVVTGAIIGGLALFILSFVATVYSGVIAALGLAALLGLVAYNFLFG